MQMVLAQRGSSQDVMNVLILLAVLIGLVLIAGVVMLVVRKRMIRNEQVLAGSVFDDLKRMRDEAQISQHEYDYLRKAIAAKAAGREPPPRPADFGPLPGELRARPGFDLTGEPLPPEVLRALAERKEAE